MKNRNKGFTLIEMILVVAIIAVFLGVVTNFITGGSNSYRNTSGNARAQMEAQETLDQLQDLIIDANRSVYYAHGSASEGGELIRGSAMEASGSDMDSVVPGTKTFFVCNRKEVNGQLMDIVDAVTYDPSSKQLLYARSTGPAAPDEPEGPSEEGASVFSAEEDYHLPVVQEGIEAYGEPTQETGAILAENIVQFAADISRATTERLVRFRIVVEDHGKSVSTDHEVHLRNNVQVIPPGGSFEEGDVTDAAIKIIDWPSIIYSGDEGRVLCSIHGNVDISSILWSLDSEDGAGITRQNMLECWVKGETDVEKKVTVTVEARNSKTGKKISDSVTIMILPRKQEVVKKLEISGQRILAAPGAHMSGSNQYALSSILGVTLIDSEGNNRVVTPDCIWKLISEPVVGASFDPANGMIVVNSSVGSHANTMTFQATYNDGTKDIAAEWTLKFAQLQITSPQHNQTYKVGDTKQFTGQILVNGAASAYQVGGNAWKHGTGTENMEDKNFLAGKFAKEDVGSWDVWAECSYSPDIYGILQDQIQFEVEPKLEFEITGPLTIVADDSYTAGIYGNPYYLVSGLDELAGTTWDPAYELVWTTEGNTSSISIVQNDNGRGMGFTVGPGEQGFDLVLTVKYKDKVVGTAKKNIRIARIEMPYPEVTQVEIGSTYKCEAQVYISVYDGSGHTENVMEAYPEYAGTTYEWTFEGVASTETTRIINWTPKETRQSYPIRVNAKTGNSVYGGSKYGMLNPLVADKRIEIVQDPKWEDGGSYYIEMGNNKMPELKVDNWQKYLDDLVIYAYDEKGIRHELSNANAWKDAGITLSKGKDNSFVSVKFVGSSKGYVRFEFVSNGSTTTFISKP